MVSCRCGTGTASRPAGWSGRTRRESPNGIFRRPPRYCVYVLGFQIAKGMQVFQRPNTFMAAIGRTYFGPRDMGCIPAAGEAWVAWPHHKTGTAWSSQLWARLAHAQPMATVVCDAWIANEHGNHMGGFDDCLRNASAVGAGVLVARMRLSSLQLLKSLFGTRIRLIHLVRSPIDTVLSEYYYARDTAPEWEYLAGGRLYSPLSSFEGFSQWGGSATIRETLRLLTPRSGVLLIASLTLVEIDTQLAVRDQWTISSTVLPQQFNDSQFYEIDLLGDFVHTGYIPTVERIFSFLMQTTLQTTQPSLSACLKLAAPLDASMSTQGSTVKHSSVHDGTRVEHAQLRQMLEVMFRNRQYHVSNYPHCPLHASCVRPCFTVVVGTTQNASTCDRSRWSTPPFRPADADEANLL